MSIAHSVTSTNTATSGTTITVASFTVSGVDPVLIAKAGVRSTTITITGVTWNGAEAFTAGPDDRNDDAHTQLWYLPSPTAATDDIVVTYSGTVNRATAAVSLYTGADNTTPVREAANASNNGTDAAPTVDVVALNTEMVVDSLTQVSAGPDTATGDHTERSDFAATGSGTDIRGASQEKASTGATETMGWTMGGSENWAIAAMALQVPITSIPGTFSLLSNQPEDATSSIDENVDSTSLINKFI